MKRAIPLILLAPLSLLAPAPALWAAPGDVATSWLKIPTSARAAAMGGAFGAVGDDVDSLGINPAGLAGIRQNQVSFMQTFWAQDLSFQHLAFGQPFSAGSGGAVAVDYMSFGTVEKFILGPNGLPVSSGNYNPSAINLYGGYGQPVMDGLFAGGSVKFLLQSIQVTDSATVAVDGGLLYRPWGSGASFGLVLSNVGGTLDTAGLPLQLKAAAAYHFTLGEGPAESWTGAVPEGKSAKHSFTFSADGDFSLHDTGFTNFRVGTEYWYNQLIALRAGYRFAPYGDLDGIAGLAVGFGIRYEKGELSYALTTQGDMGTTHQISISFMF